MGRCFGPAKNKGNEMSQWVLKQNGQILPRKTMRKLTRDELVRELEIKKRNGFDAEIKIRYGDQFTLPTRTRVKVSSQEADDTSEVPFDEIAPDISEADIVDAQGKSMNPSSVADMFMNKEVLLTQGEDVWLAKVIRRNVNSDDKVLGYYNGIPMLNTILYDVQFPDGVINP